MLLFKLELPGIIPNYLFNKNLISYLYLIAGNAIANATVPVMDKFCLGQSNAYTTLDASGLSVGLPAGLMGNSEVGHLNIGAGRVVYQVNYDLMLFSFCNYSQRFTAKLPVRPSQ